MNRAIFKTERGQTPSSSSNVHARIDDVALRDPECWTQLLLARHHVLAQGFRNPLLMMKSLHEKDIKPPANAKAQPTLGAKRKAVGWSAWLGLPSELHVN
jgi:hypothetical protein